MTHPLDIKSLEVFVVGPDVERMRFAESMGPVYESLTLLKVTTQSGHNGIAGTTLFSEYTFDQSLGASLKTLLPAVLGQSAQQPQQLLALLRGKYNNMSPKPHGLIDIALWDCLATFHNQPLYQYLGSERNTMPCYASIPYQESIADYIQVIDAFRDDFDTFKVHVWCDLNKDIALLETLNTHYQGQGLKFILDIEESYTLQQTEKILPVLEQLDCPWLEAPMPDTQLSDYRQLRQLTDIPIVPAGNTLESIGLIEIGVAHKAWDALRVDANFAGGISLVGDIMAFGEQHQLGTELQAWGYTLSQAANLHLSLASNSTQYFELPIPYAPREACVKRGFRPNNGMVSAPDRPGLGIEIDWDSVDNQLLDHYRF